MGGAGGGGGGPPRAGAGPGAAGTGAADAAALDVDDVEELLGDSSRPKRFLDVADAGVAGTDRPAATDEAPAVPAAADDAAPLPCRFGFGSPPPPNIPSARICIGKK